MSKIDQLISKFKEFKEELNKNVNASYSTDPNSGTSTTGGSVTGTSGGQGGMYRSEDVKKDGMIGQDAMAMSECLKFDKNGQWNLAKADPKAKAKTPAKAAVKAPAATDPAAEAGAPDPAAEVAAAPVAAAAPAATPAVDPKAKDAGAGSGSGNSPTKTNTETGGSSPGGASTGGVGSGLGGAGTGGAATGGASTGGAGTVTVTISGSSSTETSSGAGAKKGGKGSGKPAGPITLNISNVGGRTDAGNVASGDGPGASGSGGHAPNGFGGGGGGASPDEPKNFSTQGKDKVKKNFEEKCEELLKSLEEFNKAKIYDFKSKKQVADIKPVKYTAKHVGITNDNKHHVYSIHADGKHVGSAKIHHENNTGEYDVDKHKVPDTHLHEVGSAVQEAHVASADHQMSEHRKAHLKTHGLAGEIKPATPEHAHNVKIQHSPEKKTNKKIKKSAEEFADEILEKLYKKSTSEEIEEVRQEMINNPVKGFGSGNKGPGMGNRGAWSVGAQGGFDGKQRSDKPTKLTFKKNGQWSLDKVDPDENINIAHPQGKAKMMKPLCEETGKAEGTNRRIAAPEEKMMDDARGRVHMVKDEGTNEEAASSKPHNKGKFKVMDEVKEKESKKEKVSGLPYNGDDKKVHKSDKVLVGTGTNDENKAPGRHSGFGF